MCKLINKFREVKYDDDGNYLYQCLNCKGYWSTRTGPFQDRNPNGQKFCGWCGIKWDGEEVWNQNIKEIEFKKIDPDYYWQIQTRILWTEKDGTTQPVVDGNTDKDGWKNTMTISGPAIKVFNKLKEERNSYDNQNFCISHEFRIKLIKTKNLSNNYGYILNLNDNSHYLHARYFDEYLKKYGGKKHHSAQERYWFKSTN